MSIQEPAWLKRTRPCPFFSQGRCLFADSCNFLHDVKAGNGSAASQPLPDIIQAKQSSHSPKPVFDPPSVVVNSASPRSVDLASSESPRSSFQDSSRYSGLLSVLSDVIGPPSNPPTETEQLAASSCAELSTTLEHESEETLIDSLGRRIGSFFQEVHGKLAEFSPIPDDEESPGGDTTSYLVHDTESYTYVIGTEFEEGDDQDMDDCGEEDPAVAMSNRQSILSSFTCASLLASPRNSVFGKSSVASPIADGAVDLLSPVQMSAKLQPFPILSLDSKVKRGDSIDSGYADGDTWVSPLPLPCSPPRSSRSPATFLSHPRRVSHTSPGHHDRRVSYDVSALRFAPPNPIEVIREVAIDETSEDNEDIACAISDAYDILPSEEQGEHEACGTSPVNDPVVAEGIAEEDDGLREVPAVMHSLGRYFLEHLRPREYDLDLCNHPSDDDLSFKTALSTQPSYGDLSDISKLSPVKQNSRLSPVSGCSTPNTSIPSHYSNTNDLLKQPTVGSHACEAFPLVSKVGTSRQGYSPGVSEARTLEECSLPEDTAIDSNVLSTSDSANNVHGPVQKKVVAPPAPLSEVFHFDRHSILSPSVDTTRSLSSAKNIPGYVSLDAGNLREFAPENVVTSGECSSGAFHSDKHLPKSSPSAKISYNHYLAKDTFSPTPGADDPAAVNVVVPQECFPTILCHDLRSPKSSSSTGGSCSPLSCTDVYAGNSDVHESALENVGAPQERLSGVLYLDNPSSSSTQGFHGPSSGEDSIESDLKSPEPPPSVSHDDLAEFVATEAVQCLENNLGNKEITESSDSASEDFTRRLSFPLPPYFPVEFVGHLTFSDEEDASALSGEAVTNLEKDASNACEVLRHDEAQSILSGSDLMAKAEPIQFPSNRSSDLDRKFVLRRSRAASDLTVKGRSSPVITLGDTPYVSGSSPPLVGRSDSVQSFYDGYFDDGTSDDGPEFPSLAHEGTPLDTSSSTGETFQDVHLRPLDQTSHVCHSVLSPAPDGKTCNPGADSPWSEIPPRPLWTGRRSLPCSSPSDLVPKENRTNVKVSSSPSHLSDGLQVREIGSTMVPLGLQRHKLQSAATQSLRITSQPLDAVFSSSEPREVLSIRTDIANVASPFGHSSAIHVSSTTQSPLSVKPMSAPPAGGLRELRLVGSFTSRTDPLSKSSTINNRFSTLSPHSSSIASSTLSLDHIFNSSTPQSPNVSPTSYSRSSSLSSSRGQIPNQTRHTPPCTGSNSPVPQALDDYPALQSLPRHGSRYASAPIQQSRSWRLSHYRAGPQNYTSVDGTHRFSRRTSTLSLSCVLDEEHEIEEYDSTISRPIQTKHGDDWTRPAATLAAPVHAIATPKPTLLFAIASDNVDQVRQVLESGEAGPNDSVGPQSALAFTLTNDKLTRKQEIVKALLAYGANPSALRDSTLNPALRRDEGDEPGTPPPETTLEGMDPATRYFVARADAAHTRQTSQLIYRSNFRPLTRVRYDVIGQDWALEQLFRVLGIHSQKLATAPIVVLLCGPSGHGKSLLARKFGSLLDVPVHTVNMTTLRSTHDIWQSYSMSPYEEPSSCTLAEFLNENEGKRCVVVLDEIEKVEDQKALWSLLMPWELGRCSLEAGKRHVDVRSVIWLGTSNIGHELVFEHHETRAEPDERMSREEYLELTGIMRPHVSHCLGASLVSRVTAVLPFVPFTLDEKMAIAAEAVYALSGDTSKFLLSPQDVESLVMKVLPSYHPSEGARSLHRAVSNILVDAI